MVMVATRIAGPTTSIVTRIGDQGKTDRARRNG